VPSLAVIFCTTPSSIRRSGFQVATRRRSRGMDRIGQIHGSRSSPGRRVAQRSENLLQAATGTKTPACSARKMRKRAWPARFLIVSDGGAEPQVAEGNRRCR
jgi:hypothetical protein